MAADGTVAAAIAAPITRRIEPEHRRTHQKVHRNSRLVGRFEDRFWAPFDRRNRSRIMQAAENYDRLHKKPGKKNGALGYIGLEVLRELMRLVDYETGRLEPAITTLMARCRKSRDAIVKALARLRDHGFLKWLRRYEETGQAGQRGPQVQQATNAYRVELPAAAARTLTQDRRDEPPTPEDEEVRRAAMVAQLREMAMNDDRDPLGQALDRLGSRVRERESDGRNESGPRVD